MRYYIPEQDKISQGMSYKEYPQSSYLISNYGSLSGGTTPVETDPILAYFQTTDANGAYYTPWDKSTLFQDAAGTVPVVNDADPTARMSDVSGNNAHAMIDVSARRPQYLGGGLKFDKVDDYLDASGIDLSGTKQVTVILIFDDNVANNGPRYLTSYPPEITHVQNGFSIASTHSSFAPVPRTRVRKSGSNNILPFPRTDAVSLATLVAKTDTLYAMRLNQVEVDTEVVSGVEYFSNEILRIGEFFESTIRALVVIDHGLDDQTVLDFENHLIEKTGVTL